MIKDISGYDKDLLELCLIIGKNIERIRGGMSQEELAKKAKISRGTVGNIEKGIPISMENLVKITKALNVKPADLCLSDFDRKEVTYKHKLLMDMISKSLKLD